MARPKYENTTPNVPRLLELLATHQVHYIIVGSVAAQVYGVDLQPGDFDITPALDQDNLARLAKVLLEIDAALPDTDEVGTWEVQPDKEKKWVSRKATPEELRQRAEWFPNPDDISTLDHLFHTPCKNAANNSHCSQLAPVVFGKVSLLATPWVIEATCAHPQAAEFVGIGRYG